MGAPPIASFTRLIHSLNPALVCSERGYVQHLEAHGVGLREQPVVPLLNHVLGPDRKVGTQLLCSVC